MRRDLLMDVLRGFLGHLGFSEMQESQPNQYCRTCCNREKALIKSQLDVTVTLTYKNGGKDSRNRDLFSGAQGPG